MNTYQISIIIKQLVILIHKINKILIKFSVMIYMIRLIRHFKQYSQIPNYIMEQAIMI